MPGTKEEVGGLLHRELSGDRAKATTAEITQFHRPPGSAGYHAATALVAERLRDWGLTDLQTTTYPLDGETVAGEGPLPLAWEPTSASVRVIGPSQMEVVSSVDVPSCLAWWSKPTPDGGMTAELVDLGTGEHDADYEGKDLKGKIALIGHTDRPAGWMYAARRAMEAGAAGILSDYLLYTWKPDRTREAHPEAVQLLRLPNQQGQFDAWACSISYPVAQRLRELLKLGPVMLHADVRCRIFAGEGRNLLATIPGEELSEEAVFFISHTSAATCPCANCAAGPALMTEIAGVLNRLIERGEIKRPRRSIKFLFLIEGLGSRWYMKEHGDQVDRIKTAFCFDSVGHDQGKLKSSLMFYKHPDSSPSFINDYFAGIMERAPKDGTWVFADDTNLDSIQFTQAPFTPWSDNHTWVAHGVPTPLIMSWPDVHFHTQFLTADKTDPRVFRRVGITTALAAYEIADAGLPEALAIADEVAARSAFRITSIASQATYRIVGANRVPTSDIDPHRLTNRVRRELAYVANRDREAVASTANLIPGEVTSEVTEALATHGEKLAMLAADATKRVESLV